MTTFEPIEWATFDAATGPVPIAWAGWLNGVYMEIRAYGGIS